MYEQIGKVAIVKPEDLSTKVRSLQTEYSFDVAFAGSLETGEYPAVLTELSIPTVWHLPEEHSVLESLRQHFDQPATILTPSISNFQRLMALDPRGVLRELQPAADLAEIKLFKQKNSPIDLREKHGISRDASVVTIVGPTIERKGQKIFVASAIELLKRHPDRELEFFIVGERPGQYLNELKQKIHQSTFSNCFHFIKESNSLYDRYPYYWISDVCVSCSTNEIFPLATLEAMGFKKAVIGTRVFRTEEVIQEDGNGFLFNAGDSQDLTEKMEWVALHRDFAEALGREGLELAMEKYALKKVATLFDRYLRESVVR
jgi:glycosyltransferase involved in cell wall biosynthesis